ncbi:hypothetical protein P43SY_003561 [Pythium insidiosum]|uniref:beta-glucosidase n=1 Tax=Pythium insidiosum TaxID=114742 RepID=A0AAD5Q5M1_PYTIN|nr:hypothetical protein P43SY_003561 [Pythium insidiosum]
MRLVTVSTWGLAVAAVVAASARGRPHEVYDPALNRPLGLVESTGGGFGGDCHGVDVDTLLSEMTRREKVAQMTQLDIYSLMNGDDRDVATALNRDATIAYARAGIGSLLNAPFPGPIDGRTGWNASEWREIIGQIKAIYREHSKTPMLYGIDTIHGATYVRGATLFPQPLSAAATFNRELVREMGRIEAQDTLAAGIPWIFSPVLGIAVQPKWSRVYETFGEDPYLASEMGAAIISGIQQSGRVAACMKHFIGYSNPTNGLDRADNVITDWDLMNKFAPSFLAAVSAGVKSAMETYVSINGEPVIASHKILTQLLRDDMQFDGLLVSDYSEIDRLHDEHQSVATVAEAVRISLNQTSLDMNMGPKEQDFFDTVERLVDEGQLTEQRLDDPEWPFGYGLSYTRYEYSGLQLNATRVKSNEFLQVQVRVTNVGSRAGQEVVLVFLTQRYRVANVPEAKLLRRFQKIELEAGASQVVTFVLDQQDWGYYAPQLVVMGVLGLVVAIGLLSYFVIAPEYEKRLCKHVTYDFSPACTSKVRQTPRGHHRSSSSRTLDGVDEKAVVTGSAGRRSPSRLTINQRMLGRAKSLEDRQELMVQDMEAAFSDNDSTDSEPVDTSSRNGGNRMLQSDLSRRRKSESDALKQATLSKTEMLRRRVLLRKLEEEIDGAIQETNAKVGGPLAIRQHPVECTAELELLSYAKDSHAIKDALRIVHDVLTVYLSTDHRDMNKVTVFCNSLLKHDGLNYLRSLEKSQDEEVRSLAKQIIEKAVPAIWH